MLAIVLPSHARDGAIEATWPRRDVDNESYCDSAVDSCW
jgi:hypothetical protein